MNYIERAITGDIKKRLWSGKAIIVYGPRQSGKTTLIKRITGSHKATLWLNGDRPDVRALLEDITISKWESVIGQNRIVVIDEAQRIKNIGLALKLITDELPEIQIIATGSSAFELANTTSEPLTGRKFEFHLLPISFSELRTHHGLLEENSLLHRRLLFGGYPEIINSPGDEQELLSMLANSYLYKDLLILEGIKKPLILDKLIRALALQIGSEMSINELSRLLMVDNKTIAKYIDLLEKTYVVFSLPAFSGNARKEIRKNRKIYFYDLGIRNAVLGNFVPIESRSDIGALWENYLIAERIKSFCKLPFPPRNFFWRNTDQREIDYLEETAKQLTAWEFKWNPLSKAKIPLAFQNAYPNALTSIVTPENYNDFLIPEIITTGKTT